MSFAYLSVLFGSLWQKGLQEIGNSMFIFNYANMGMTIYSVPTHVVSMPLTL